MNYPLQALIQMGAVPPVTFPTDSRYYGSATLQYTASNGQAITYLARRIVPQPGAPNYRHDRHAHRKTRGPSRLAGGEISRGSVHVLADLRRQRRDSPR